MHAAPARLLLFGYVSYMLLGWALLALPVAQTVPVAALDTLFTAVSAVSTTGLATLSVGGSFSLFGEVVILLLIQAGGLGYMTIGSFAVLSVYHRLGRMRTHTVRQAFNLPEGISPVVFLRSVVWFTFLCEAVGALALYLMFHHAGVPDALWMAIFHSISAFCTAGFSLFDSSLEAFHDHVGINIAISILSLLGAMGFLIVVDGWRALLGRRRVLGFTSKVIVRMTLTFLAFGTVILFVTEPELRILPPSERLMAAFFQTMSASTTVGFNTVSISGISQAVLMVLMVLMVVGASPAGTGGGLKTTSFAALLGLVRSTLKGREAVRFFKRRVSDEKLKTATASLAYYAGLCALAMFLLLLTDAAQPFEALLFEAVSAMGTVGLSTGITGDLSDLGKLVVIVLMTAGRVGILTFGMALATHDESRAEEQDDNLVL
ncbi:TrkH family potassium uptake protein [Pseudosulfitobacter koreensis]|uniref:Trk system potassium uptake protein TrkH n=1 Tax=Pseudosulfitobacter koreensis TaxID=2968472 RepID=A0ABT1Z0U8_9RHOB|nr:potassium transporter TrkG [Pseudosulfitobacter koreense]MCR8826748.1 hypothetical protein [Pseudosulfitobacter koreense]